MRKSVGTDGNPYLTDGKSVGKGTEIRTLRMSIRSNGFRSLLIFNGFPTLGYEIRCNGFNGLVDSTDSLNPLNPLQRISIPFRGLKMLNNP